MTLINVLLRPISFLNENTAATARLRFISSIATRKKKKKKRTIGGQILGQSCQSFNHRCKHCGEPVSRVFQAPQKHQTQSPITEERKDFATSETQASHSVSCKDSANLSGGKYLIAAGEHNPFSLTEGATCVGYNKSQ